MPRRALQMVHTIRTASLRSPQQNEAQSSRDTSGVAS